MPSIDSIAAWMPAATESTSPSFVAMCSQLARQLSLSDRSSDGNSSSPGSHSPRGGGSGAGVGIRGGVMSEKLIVKMIYYTVVIRTIIIPGSSWLQSSRSGKHVCFWVLLQERRGLSVRSSGLRHASARAACSAHDPVPRPHHAPEILDTPTPIRPDSWLVPPHGVHSYSRLLAMPRSPGVAPPFPVINAAPTNGVVVRNFAFTDWLYIAGGTVLGGVWGFVGGAPRMPNPTVAAVR